MAQNNSTIMAHAWLAASNDFQQRIPNPTQAGITATMQKLFEPMNGNFYNEFLDVLINRIGGTYIHQTRFENPLGVFKKGMMEYGTTVQEVAVNWVKAHAYDQDSGAELLKLELPEGAVWYHTLNRKDKYAISVSVDQLRAAFTSEYGLNNLLDAIFDAPRMSDNYDEYRIMMQLISEYLGVWGAYTEQMGLPVNDATGKAFLTYLRAVAKKLTFPSNRYIAADIDIPVAVKPNELVLLITPEAQASLDVNTLASIFHLDKAEVDYRTVVVDEFPVDDMYAALTTEAWFMCWDNLYQTQTFWNPDNLTNKHYLHHWGTYSASPFTPFIAFRTETASSIFPVVTQSVTGFELTAEADTAKPGDIVSLNPVIQGDLTVSDDAPATAIGQLKVSPDSATFAIEAQIPTDPDDDDSVAQPVQLNSRTYVDRMFDLHIQKSGLKAGTVLTVTGISTYMNPSGNTTGQMDSVEITISEDSK